MVPCLVARHQGREADHRMGRPEEFGDGLHDGSLPPPVTAMLTTAGVTAFTISENP